MSGSATSQLTAPPLLRGSALVLMTIGLALATFMEVLDITIANVSVPTIAGDLAVSPTQGTWVITSYGVANAITVLLAGWLSRRFGEVKVFVTCSFAFAVASFICGLSASLGFLVVTRVLQGAVAGPMVTMSQALLLRNYAPEKRGIAMSIWAMTVVVAPMLGPILGGYITDHYNWPWIFFVNVPVGILSTLLVWNALRDRETPVAQDRVDYVGFALVVLGVGSLQICLDKGKELDWFASPLIAGLAIVSAVALTALIIWELAEDQPVINLRLLLRRNFVVAVAVMSIGYGAMFSSVILMPLFLQTQLAYTATWAGLTIAPVGILSLLLSPLIGRNIQKFDLRMIVTVSMIVFALASFWRSSFTTGADFAYYAMPQLLQGVAIACFFSPLVGIYTGGLPMSDYASASSLMNFSRMIAGSMATSAVTTIWDNREAVHQTYLADQLTDNGPRMAALTDAFTQSGMDLAAGAAQAARLLAQQAYMLAANDIFFVSGCVFVALIPVIWFSRPVRLKGGMPAAH